MTRDDLEEIRNAEKTIHAKKLELEALRYKASGTGAIRYDNDAVQTSPQDYMVMAVADVIEIEKQIKEDEEEIEKLRGDAYTIVRQIADPEQRAIIEWYYLNGLSMIETAVKMNMSERTAYYLRDDAITSFEAIF